MMKWDTAIRKGRTDRCLMKWDTAIRQRTDRCLVKWDTAIRHGRTDRCLMKWDTAIRQVEGGHALKGETNRTSIAGPPDRNGEQIIVYTLTQPFITPFLVLSCFLKTNTQKKLAPSNLYQ